MATLKKPAVDPLVEELPPEPVEPSPAKAEDIKFTVQVSPYVVNGDVFYRWQIIDHEAKAYIADYSGQGNSGLPAKEIAETDAAQYVERIRHTVDLKLNLPEAYTVVL